LLVFRFSSGRSDRSELGGEGRVLGRAPSSADADR
jgi:hypothetical protein